MRAYVEPHTRQKGLLDGFIHDIIARQKASQPRIVTFCGAISKDFFHENVSLIGDQNNAVLREWMRRLELLAKPLRG